MALGVADPGADPDAQAALPSAAPGLSTSHSSCHAVPAASSCSLSGCCAGMVLPGGCIPGVPCALLRRDMFLMFSCTHHCHPELTASPGLQSHTPDNASTSLSAKSVTQSQCCFLRDGGKCNHLAMAQSLETGDIALWQKPFNISSDV